MVLPVITAVVLFELPMQCLCDCLHLTRRITHWIFCVICIILLEMSFLLVLLFFFSFITVKAVWHSHNGLVTPLGYHMGKGEASGKITREIDPIVGMT